MIEEYIYNTDSGFSLDDIRALVFGEAKLSLPADALNKVDHCFHFLEKFSKEKIIYGINTGFGPMAQYRIEDHSLKELQYNIIRSHSTGAGEALPPIYVKAAMIARLSTFLQGYSGVHTELIVLLTEFINHNVFPRIPAHGGVGASGDLVQLAHIALTLIGEGEVMFEGNWDSSENVMKKLRLTPFKVRIREGLSVTNGTSVMTGIGLINLIYARQLLALSVTASVMVNEIASSFDDFASPVLNGTKRHSGQQRIAKMMLSCFEDSRSVLKREEILFTKNEEKIFSHKVQPYYSLRCVPQILGPILDTIDTAEKVLVNELNSACDNPIIDPETENVYHGGNFHGDYVSFEMDKLKIAITKLTMLTERQLNYLFHDRINGILPPFVNLGVLGLNYGLQAAQFTATSTTAESQTLSNPMYIHSIPCNNDNQDIVSMGTNSALLAKTVIDNGFQVMAIHFMAIVQAIDYLQSQDKLSGYTRGIYQELRDFFPVFKEDTPKYKEIEKMIVWLKNKQLSLRHF